MTIEIITVFTLFIIIKFKKYVQHQPNAFTSTRYNNMHISTNYNIHFPQQINTDLVMRIFISKRFTIKHHIVPMFTIVTLLKYDLI